MASPVEMTYVALRRIRVGGEDRYEGDLVPEAKDWHNIDAYLRTGRIASVPRATVDSEELQIAEDHAEERAQANRELAERRRPPETEPAEGTEESDEDVEEFHTGQGWYEIPGADKKMRRDEAVEYLSSLEGEEE